MAVTTKKIPGTEPDKSGAVENWVDSFTLTDTQHLTSQVR